MDLLASMPWHEYVPTRSVERMGCWCRSWLREVACCDESRRRRLRFLWSLSALSSAMSSAGNVGTWLGSGLAEGHGITGTSKELRRDPGPASYLRLVRRPVQLARRVRRLRRIRRRQKLRGHAGEEGVGAGAHG